MASDFIYCHTIFLVNTRSGARKGDQVLRLLRRWDYSAYDLSEFHQGDDGLYQKLGSELQAAPEAVVISAGGDGAASWALRTIDRALRATMHRRSQQREAYQIPAFECKIDDRFTKYIHSRDESYFSLSREEFSSSEIKNAEETSEGMKEAAGCCPLNSSPSTSPVWLKNSSHVMDWDRSFQMCYSTGRIKLGVLPLGTGNDLSRALGWGHTFPGEKVLRTYVDFMTRRSKTLTWLDRWRAVFYTANGEVKEWRSNHMLCYLSVGWTADVAYEFHRARESNPLLYDNILVNKLKYIQLGVKKSISRNPRITPLIQLLVDGREIPLDQNITTLCIHNIRSMSDGIDFWENSRGDPSEWKDATMGDGLLEVTSSTSVASFVKSKIKLAGYSKVIQGSELWLVLKQPMAIQLDGESWIEEPGTLRLQLASKLQVPVGPINPLGVQIIAR